MFPNELANNLLNLPRKRNGFYYEFLLYNGVPCISRLNLQWYHVLIILSANRMTQLQKLRILYYITPHYSSVLLDCPTTDPV